MRSSKDFACDDVMGVMVIELGNAVGAAAVMGMISIPGRLSRHNIEDILGVEPVGVLGALVPIGVMLTDEGMYGFPSVRSRSRDEVLLLLRESESLFFNFCRL